MLCLSTSSENKWQTVMKCPPPRPRRTSYLASGVWDAAAGLVELGCDLAGDVATSLLDGFRASGFGGGCISVGYKHFACTSWAQRSASMDPGHTLKTTFSFVVRVTKIDQTHHCCDAAELVQFVGTSHANSAPPRLQTLCRAQTRHNGTLTLCLYICMAYIRSNRGERKKASIQRVISPG